MTRTVSGIPISNIWFRKVTNGFRSLGADLYAAVRSTLNTGRKQGLSAFQAMQRK